MMNAISVWMNGPKRQVRAVEMPDALFYDAAQPNRLLFRSAHEDVPALRPIFMRAGATAAHAA